MMTYWKNIDCLLKGRGQEPIVIWIMIKVKLREKYLLIKYSAHLVDHWQCIM